MSATVKDLKEYLAYLSKNFKTKKSNLCGITLFPVPI